jgi:hypothetical protein
LNENAVAPFPKDEMAVDPGTFDERRTITPSDEGSLKFENAKEFLAIKFFPFFQTPRSP